MVVVKALQGTATRRDVIKGTLKAGAYAAPVIAAGAIPFAVGAVTGPTGARLLINGANTATIAFGSSFTLTGSGYTPNSVIYRIILNPRSTPPLFSSLGLTTDANGNFSNTVNTLSNVILRSGGAGTYTVVITNIDPFTVNGGMNVPINPFPGELVRLSFTETVPAGTMLAAAPSGNVNEGSGS